MTESNPEIFPRSSERISGSPRRVRYRGSAPRASVRALALLAGGLALVAGGSARVLGGPTREDSREKGLAFEIRCTVPLSKDPGSARVYVLLGPDRASTEPRFGPDWFRPQPFFAVDVPSW
jgi:hypothetical protein